LRRQQYRAAVALLPGPLKLLLCDSRADVRINEGIPAAKQPRVLDEYLDFATGPPLRVPRAGDLVAAPLYPSEVAIVVRRSDPFAAVRSLADRTASEWVTAGLGTVSLVVDDIFTAASLPTPRWATRCEPTPGQIWFLAKCDLIATIPRSLLALGIADRLLNPIRVRGKMASSTMSLYINRDTRPVAARTRPGHCVRACGPGAR
jgi:DNA-binding transcriptional LysR family regulator